MRSKSLILLETQPLTSYGIEQFLENNNYRITKTFNNGFSCLNFLLTHKIDIAIINLEVLDMPGLELIKQCRKSGVKTKFIVLTTSRTERTFFQALDLQVSGYLMKHDGLNVILKCLNNVVSNSTYYSKNIDKGLVDSTKSEESLSQFSNAHRRILKLIASGKTSKEMADILIISIRTIESHRYSIRKKINSNLEIGISLQDWVSTHL